LEFEKGLEQSLKFRLILFLNASIGINRIKIA